MLRTALVVIAAALLGGCVSLGHARALNPLQPAITDLAIAASCGCAEPPDLVQASASPAPLDRRRFTPPSGRAPDQRAIFLTASDYAWRSKRGHARRRRRRRR